MSGKSVVKKPSYSPGNLISWSRDQQTFNFSCDKGVILQVIVLGDDMIRFRFQTQGYIEKDFSYAIDPAFEQRPTEILAEEKTQYVELKTSLLKVQVHKSGLRHTVKDKKGNILMDDDKGFHWEEDSYGSDIVMMSKVSHEDEYYFGLGDKSCALNLRGERLNNWATDSFGYGPETDPLYRAIPFYFSLFDGRSYGIFFDNSFRSYFDFAAEREDATSFWAHGGEMNYYFIYGPEMMQVAERYTDLTGRPELPPLWALGFHQCKWSYYPEAEVKSIAEEFRSRKIPCDAIYLDIDYMDGYRCFTWNLDHFPDPPRMIAELKEQGFETVVMIDPGIKVDPDYFVYKEGIENDYFARRMDGPYLKGKVWPGDCYFPDYTRPEVREWWGGLYKDLIRKVGISGFWNDMNEPAFFGVDSKTAPMDARFDYDGHPGSHRKAHNIYGMQMSRASYDGIKELSYPKRPFLITRATYSGGQRFASVWTGDNNATWEHLQLANTQSQRMSISGFSFIGSDIGGFNGVPDGELFTRWVQVGMFHPLFRVHSIGFNDVGDDEIDEEVLEKNKASELNRDQEPWSFGEPYTAAVKKAIELRYKLLPYLYTAFYQYSSKGTPILRPGSFLDQHDPETLDRMEEFCFGDHILACPISEKGAEGRYLYLPKGQWYCYRSEKPILGEQEIWTDTALDEIPMYIRAGAVIPTAPVMQYSSEKKIEQLSLHVYYKNGKESSQLYADANEGYDYQEGGYTLRNFHTKGGTLSFGLKQEIEGNFKPDYDKFKVVFHGLPFKADKCMVDGKPVEISFTPFTTDVIVDRDFTQIEIA